ncbi:phosphotransferase enzyme family protein [Paenibacillus puldeungensis]|uniref:Phosphotransferase enzyme family protein n=1 Tax=Paenibacillus puldeungensis TaxID=696536 RepID=A0ABW3RU60_9BACL
MLKLKYLFNNLDLTEMILKNWHFDQSSMEMFKYYRISSNAIYPFQCNGETRLLRYAPKSEKRKSNIQAELEFISYLRDNHYGVLEPIQSNHGEELVEVATPWGEYYATVFKRVPGMQINHTECSDDIIFSYGKALGKLHHLSSQYKTHKIRRWSYVDVLVWVEDVLRRFPGQEAALNEIKILENFFSSIPKSERNFGLVHYDFEFDNVFYDEETNSCYVIDFDDAMYHWYAMDIVQALDDLQECTPIELFHQKKECFINGYLTEYDIPNNLNELMIACRRFAKLYGYARIQRSIGEKWGNEPDWLVTLRGKLEYRLKEDVASFGTAL